VSEGFPNDAPVINQEQLSHGYRGLLVDPGIASLTDFPWHRDQIRQAVPVGWGVAEAIIAATRAMEAQPPAVTVLPRLKISVLLVVHGSRR
jgi:hypothetical protein